MPADSGLWLPPLSPKAQEKVNRRQKYQGLVKWTGFPEKTLWDWLQLLSVLAIPVVIAAGTLWFTAQQSEASSQTSEWQHQTDLQAAQDQQQESALQAYLDRMSDLLLNSKLRESQSGDEVRNVARARTLTVLPQLSSTQKAELVHFLQEAGLIDQEDTIISLDGADLWGADFWEANLDGADLSRSSLGDAKLEFANLVGANLTGASLMGADLYGASLTHANLSDVSLFGASLTHANISDANLEGADLEGAKLSYVNLKGAKVTQWQLKQAWSLTGAIMPDGSRHP